VKPCREEEARELFAGTAINVTTEGQKHLGAALGSKSYLEEYVNDKVVDWVNEVKRLAEFSVSQPQACFAAFTFGLTHRWTYFLRTLLDIDTLLEPLERAEVLIPSITERNCSPAERDLFELPVRLGGLGFLNPVEDGGSEYKASVSVTAPLVNQIVGQAYEPADEADVNKLRRRKSREKEEVLRRKYDNLKRSPPEKMQRIVELGGVKGPSKWLSVIPLKEMSFDLNKREFRDAIRLRYDWPIPDTQSLCVCGVRFTVDHAMICKRVAFIIQRHNELQDLEAELLKMLCYDVEVEPGLQPVTGEELNRGANQSHDARLDVHARGFWERQISACFDIRVCHSHADSYKDLTLKHLYKQQDNEKKHKYASRILEVEQGTFIPLVFSTTGGMGEECARYHARLAELLAIKKGETYSTMVSWIRAKASFALVRGALLCLRGSRGNRKLATNIHETDFEIERGLTGLS